MSAILQKIYNEKLIEIEIIKSRCSLSSLKKLLPKNENREFKKLLEISQKKNCINIVAEIKKSSPSAGNIIKNYNPDDIASIYEKSGAGAISILTEKKFFDGSIDHLSVVKQKTNIPILRKDFIIDVYQIYESKVYNADAILLIVTILSDDQIKKFIKICNEIGLDCIVEVHNAEELKRAIKINYPIIGINNRNLDNLSIDIENTLKLIKNISKDFTILGESGIKEYKDIETYNNSGIYNFLIGETLLKANNINLKFKELLNK